MAGNGAEKLIVENRRARHEYNLLDRVEAGLALAGSEVKSLRQGHAILQRAYADARDGELWLVGLHIPPYEQASQPHDRTATASCSCTGGRSTGSPRRSPRRA